MLNILVLHAMGPRKKWFAGVSDVELMFPLYDGDSRYIVHNAYTKFPKLLKYFPFDAIIMMSTFMDVLTYKGTSGRWIKQYEFLKLHVGTKIVFPQDDYWFSEERDQFYCEYNIDRIYPVCPPESWHELIPRYLERGGEAKQGYTTYVTPRIRELRRFSQPVQSRENHVTYRATKSPKAPNKYGIIKGSIGDLFDKKVNHSKIKCDISTDPKNLIYGDAWYRFVANSRAIIGSNSGSSVRLRNLSVFEDLRKYQREHPWKSGLEVEYEFFAPDDRGKEYTAISPRNVEAAMLGTLQVLVEGPYSNILEPNTHYVPLDVSCDNIATVMEIVNNDVQAEKITEACREKISTFPNIQVENTIEDVSAFIKLKSEVNLCKVANHKYGILWELIFMMHDVFSPVLVESKGIFIDTLKFFIRFFPQDFVLKIRNFRI